MALTPTLLLILDGYGLPPDNTGDKANAAFLAKSPTLKRLLSRPLGQGFTTLCASGRAVGLPEGFMGNSEVGHLNIGAGRIVYQDMTKIDLAIEEGEFAHNPVLVQTLEAAKKNGGRVHFLGLLSAAGVHSHIHHLKALLELSQRMGVQALVHAFLDGRDTSPTSAGRYVTELEGILAKTGGKIASLCGRFYAMDRDKRWERVEQAWNLLIKGEGQLVPQGMPLTSFIEEEYKTGKTDEFFPPIRLLPVQEEAIRAGDAVFFFNFRADRARQLMHAFADETFTFFARGEKPRLAALASMTSYEETLDDVVAVAFPKDNLNMTLGEVVQNMGLKQLRIAETEKYAHVTYFFSGGREAEFEGESRFLIPSPKEVATYDLKPEMSATAVTEKLIAEWNTGQYTLCVCNLANPDMVGHTGNLQAAIRAVETVDACVAAIEQAVLAKEGRLIITADHGNVEVMMDAEGKPHTAHTTNRTPFILVEKAPLRPLRLPEDGNPKLADIAPTILDLWGIALPDAMKGQSLLKH